MIQQAPAMDAKNQRIHSGIISCNCLFVIILFGQLEFSFDMTKSVDAVWHCDKDGIKAFVDKFNTHLIRDILNINSQIRPMASEMELTVDEIQKEMTEIVYRHYYRM